MDFLFWVLVEFLVIKYLFLLVEGRVVIDGYFLEGVGELFGMKEIYKGGLVIYLCIILWKCYSNFILLSYVVNFDVFIFILNLK